MRAGGGACGLERLRTIDALRPRVDRRGELFGRASVALRDEGTEVVAVEHRATREHAAAHDVEQHVGTVVGGGHRVGRLLQAIGPRQQFIDARSVGGQCGADLGGRAAAGIE